MNQARTNAESGEKDYKGGFPKTLLFGVCIQDIVVNTTINTIYCLS